MSSRLILPDMFRLWSISSTFYANFPYKSLFGSFFYLHVTREKLLKRRSYEIFLRKMLIKLTPEGTTFIDTEIFEWQSFNAIQNTLDNWAQVERGSCYKCLLIVVLETLNAKLI